MLRAHSGKMWLVCLFCLLVLSQQQQHRVDGPLGSRRSLLSKRVQGHFASEAMVDPRSFLSQPSASALTSGVSKEFNVISSLPGPLPVQPQAPASNSFFEQAFETSPLASAGISDSLLRKRVSQMRFATPIHKSHKVLADVGSSGSQAYEPTFSQHSTNRALIDFYDTDEMRKMSGADKLHLQPKMSSMESIFQALLSLHHQGLPSILVVTSFFIGPASVMQPRTGQYMAPPEAFDSKLQAQLELTKRNALLSILSACQAMASSVSTCKALVLMDAHVSFTERDLEILPITFRPNLFIQKIGHRKNSQPGEDEISYLKAHFQLQVMSNLRTLQFIYESTMTGTDGSVPFETIGQQEGSVPAQDKAIYPHLLFVAPHLLTVTGSFNLDTLVADSRNTAYEMTGISMPIVDNGQVNPISLDFLFINGAKLMPAISFFEDAYSVYNVKCHDCDRQAVLNEISRTSSKYGNMENWANENLVERLMLQQRFWIKSAPNTEFTKITSQGIRMSFLPCSHYLSSPLGDSGYNANGLCKTTPLAGIVDMRGKIAPFMQMLHSVYHERGRLVFLNLLDSLYDLTPDQVIEKLSNQYTDLEVSRRTKEIAKKHGHLQHLIGNIH